MVAGGITKHRATTGQAKRLFLFAFIYQGPLTEEELIAAMVDSPRLIERPIVLAHGRAAIGRPPEAVLGIL